jgi:competence protein ComFC
LSDEEKMICSKCRSLYLYPNENKDQETFMPLNNLVEDVYVWSVYSYTKQAIWDFKFKNDIYTGKVLANLFADKLKNVPWIRDIDFIVPVPLHKKRERQRGFNQSLIIADIVGAKLGIPVISKNLIRLTNNIPQHESRGTDRYDNVKDNFKIINPYVFSNAKILLIDDVITTCSTMKCCCESFNNINNVKIYVACLASDRVFA